MVQYYYYYCYYYYERTLASSIITSEGCFPGGKRREKERDRPRGNGRFFLRGGSGIAGTVSYAILTDCNKLIDFLKSPFVKLIILS